MWSFVSQMVTRIYYGANPQFSIADILALIIEGLSTIWIELTLSVLATIVYGVSTGIIAWVPPAKAQPKSEEAHGNTPSTKLQSSYDLSPKVERASSSPKRGFQSVLILLVIIAGMGVGAFVALPSHTVKEEEQKRPMHQPKTEKDDAIAILNRQLAQSPDAAAQHKLTAAIAATQRAQGDLKGAAKHFAEAAEAANEAKDEWGRYEALLAHASLQRRLGYFSEAATSAMSAVEIAKKGLPEASDLESLIARRDSMMAKAAAHAELAQIRRDEGKLIEAGGLFQMTDKIDVEVAQAAYHVLKGSTEEAVQSLVRALERLQGLKRAEALLWLGRAQRDLGKNKEALEASQMAASTAGSSAPDTAASALLDAAGVLMQMAEYNEAEASLKAAEELLAAKDLDLLLADVEIAKAAILLHRDEALIAESMVKNALALKRAAGGENSLAATHAMVLLGQTLLAQARHEDALKIFEDAQKNMIKIHGFFHGLTARLKWHIAAAHKAMGKHQWAIMQRRWAIDDVITPPRGSAEFSPAAAADRMVAILFAGHNSFKENEKENEMSVEKRQICSVLRERDPFNEKAVKRRSDVLKAWGRCQGM